VARLEEVLEAYREGASPDRRGFDALQRRLADHGIEDEMLAGHVADGAESTLGAGDDEEDEEKR
jgi:hypothetical protein